MLDTQNYLFIDGNYLRRAYEDSMRRFFSDVHHRNLDFATIKQQVGASKAFYYDSVDDSLPDAVDRQQYLDEIRSLDGFHVRRGTITGQARKQKRVDVQLAVECLTHAHNKNIWHATLIAGDLDFEPLVSALISSGTHVHVFYERRSAARDLYHAADVASEITLETFWSWSSLRYRKTNPAPHFDNTIYGAGTLPQDVHTIPDQGTWNGRPVMFCTSISEGTCMLHFPRHDDAESMTFRFTDRERLEKYFVLCRGGELRWNAAASPR